MVSRAGVARSAVSSLQPEALTAAIATTKAATTRRLSIAGVWRVLVQSFPSSVSSKNPTMRRSYSSGAASIAPVCPPGAAQYSFGPFAAS